MDVLIFFIEHHPALHSLTDLTESATCVDLMAHHRFWKVLMEKIVALLVHVLITSWFSSCRYLGQVFPILSSSHDLSPEQCFVLLFLCFIPLQCFSLS